VFGSTTLVITDIGFRVLNELVFFIFIIIIITIIIIIIIISIRAVFFTLLNW
jgi:hypothetical protein